MQKLTFALLCMVILVRCTAPNASEFDSFDVYCEMVANDAKPIALSQPMTSNQLDEVWDAYQESADNFGVKLYRESDFPVTELWPSTATAGKEVVLIYKEPRLVQYQQLKADLSRTSASEAARRFGRLLGYSNKGINDLLMSNTNFRTLESFGVEEQTTHLYYKDLTVARTFYGEVLGLNELSENIFQIGVGANLHLHDYTSEHPEGQAKSTAIAFLTDQLPEWYAYVQQQGVPIKYTYKPKEGGPHDGFVAIDPEGYLLEFEEFKQHPENEVFMAVLEDAQRIDTKVPDLNFFGSITWTYHNDLLKMQQFYEEDLGFRMVADQGWTKIYQTSKSGFIGLVDERRGMMDYADEKAIEIEWEAASAEAINYYSSKADWESEKAAIQGPEKYYYRISN